MARDIGDDGRCSSCRPHGRCFGYSDCDDARALRHMRRCNDEISGRLLKILHIASKIDCGDNESLATSINEIEALAASGE